MSTGSALHSPALCLPGIAHGFFTRLGGVSEGVYASLNGGVGSRDVPEAVAENRRRMAQTLGVGGDSLLVPYQIHSADVVVATRPWAPDERPRADGLVTNVPGLALGVTGADCGMVLFADAQARVIGACHSGWKGALTGILEATLAAMETLGATRSAITAVLGPMIAQTSYEVGPEFVPRFVDQDAANARFFRPSGRADHALFDLPAYIGARMNRAGIAAFHDLALDTYADAERFYSYRRSVHRAEPDYGRLVSAIALV
jgi:YfiH family protein